MYTTAEAEKIDMKLMLRAPGVSRLCSLYSTAANDGDMFFIVIFKSVGDA